MFLDYDITTFDQMKEWVKAQLGHPVIHLEMELESRNGLGHVDMAIKDAIKWFEYEDQDQGSYKDFMIIFLQPGVHTYDTPEDLVQVVEAQPVYGNGFTPFTSFDVGSRESLVATTGWAQFHLVTYVAAQMYLGDVKKYIGKKYDLKFFPAQKKVRVYPTPRDSEDRVIITTVYRAQQMYEYYNHPHLRKLMVEYARRQWGTILYKDIVTLPGGGRVNGEGILAEANKKIEEIEAVIRSQSSPPMISVG